MIETSIFAIKPTGPFHIGSEGVGLEATSELLHSDTLFSALCHAWLLLGDSIPGQDWPVRLSSVFPVVAMRSQKELSKNISASDLNNSLYLFPRPLLDIEPWMHIENGKPTKQKSWKSAKWVSFSILEKFRNGEILKNPILAHGGDTIVTEIEKKQYLAHKEPLWKSGLHSIVPRVKIGRTQNTSQLYHVGRTMFSPNVGLYFMFAGPESEKKRIAQALEILGDCGIGGERTYGYGQFKNLGNHTLTFADSNSSRHQLFSLFHPVDANEVQKTLHPPASYHLLERKGFMDSLLGRSYRRKRVLMVGEGSILTSLPNGGRPDVRPERTKDIITHKVLRNGFAFSLPGVYELQEGA